MKDNAKRQITFVTILIWLMSMTSVIASPVNIMQMDHSKMSEMSMVVEAVANMQQDTSQKNCKCKDDCKTCECSMCNQSCAPHGFTALYLDNQTQNILDLSTSLFYYDTSKSHIKSFTSRLYRPPIQ